MFANCSMPGMDIAFPDTCLTPGVLAGAPGPIPYPNIATKAMAIPPTASMTHLIMFMPTHNMATTIPTSNGDEAGCSGGGVASALFIGPARNTKCSVSVITGGTPATRMLDTTLQNSTNAPGMSLVPGQFQVLILT